MKVKDRSAMVDRFLAAKPMVDEVDLTSFIEREIDRAVRKARREARSEATTCVDCRVVLLGEVPLCSACRQIRNVYGIDRDSRKRFSREDADRMDQEAEEP